MNAPQNPWDTQGKGFALAWGVGIGSAVIAFALGISLGNLPGSTNAAFAAGMLPPIALLGLLAIAHFSGLKQMAAGVLAAFGAMFALVLLGVAACFGIVGIGGM